MDPYTRTEIQSALLEQLARLRSFYASLPGPVFFTKPPTGWSPAGNVRHLTNATLALLVGLSLPRFLLRLLFGKSKKPSQRTATIRSEYLAHLNAGATAGIYTPLPLPELRPRAQERMLDRLESMSLCLLRRLNAFTEEDLDRLSLPHPILGRRTLREMLLFQFLHNDHHTNKVKSRQKNG
ncbi:MAG: DinB family protein [Spirochaetales bacterium]|nr:DinB family protein [Spirochaetales bacterium]